MFSISKSHFRCHNSVFHIPESSDVIFLLSFLVCKRKSLEFTDSAAFSLACSIEGFPWLHEQGPPPLGRVLALRLWLPLTFLFMLPHFK